MSPFSTSLRRHRAVPGLQPHHRPHADCRARVGTIIGFGLIVAMLHIQACGSESADDNPAPGPASVFPAVDDFAKHGPYFHTQERLPEVGCTIVRPLALGEGGVKHPVIVWGNGTAATPVVYMGVLRHWASHGFIVAAADTNTAGSGTEMLACLDWLINRNNNDATYGGHVDVDRVGAAGHSQGGGGALMVGSDSRISATAPLQPFILEGFGGFSQKSLSQQQGPMFLMSGSLDTVAPPDLNQQPVYDQTNVPTAWGTLRGADHFASAIGDITGFRGPATAWFRLHLMGDESARTIFYGDNCGLCTNPAWQLERKEME
jgi:predicted dienelactone hydrolase